MNSAAIDCPRVRQTARVAYSGRLAIATLSAVLGLAYAYLLVGGRVLNPFDITWMSADPATAHLGWAFFRQHAALSFPIGWTPAIGYPMGEAIAYLDSMPLLGFIAWLFRGVLPPAFQYLGPWFVVCSCLQFYFGYRLSRRLCGTELSAILGGLLFLTAPAFTWRAFGHFTLVTQWLILAAVEVLLAAEKGINRGTIVWTTVLCFLSASSHPYLAVMTLLVCSAAHLRSGITDATNFIATGIAITVNLSAIAAGFVIFGFLQFKADTSLYAGSLYELASMNLLSLIDPQQWPSILLKRQPWASEFQFEGYNYLGLGILLLAMTAVARSPMMLRVLFNRSYVPVLGVIVVSLFLAMSTRGTVGSQSFYHVKLPKLIMTALQTFRASGRLFWPAYYLLFAGTLAAASRSFPRRWLPIALSVAVILQFTDLTALRSEIHRTWAVSSVPTLKDPAWRILGRAQQHLVALPAYQCGPEDTPGGVDGYSIFGRIAVDQNMTINSFYAGRYSGRQIQYQCVQAIMDLRQHGMMPDTAYVVAADRAAVLVGVDAKDRFCRLIEHYVLCSAEPGKAGFEQPVSSLLPQLGNGAVLRFQGDAGKQVLGGGWSSPETWGRWTLGAVSDLSFRAVRTDRPLPLKLTVRPFVVPGSHQRVEISVNGAPPSTWTFTRADDQILNIEAPPNLIAPDGLITLQFRLSDAMTPESVQASWDVRLLALGLLQLEIGSPAGS